MCLHLSQIYRFLRSAKAMTPFNCEQRCQAPDSFFSGVPWPYFPEAGKDLILKPDVINPRLQWQLWRDSQDVTFKLHINSGKKFGLTGDNLRPMISHNLTHYKCSAATANEEFVPINYMCDGSL